MNSEKREILKNIFLEEQHEDLKDVITKVVDIKLTKEEKDVFFEDFCYVIKRTAIELNLPVLDSCKDIINEFSGGMGAFMFAVSHIIWDERLRIDSRLAIVNSLLLLFHRVLSGDIPPFLKEDIEELENEEREYLEDMKYMLLGLGFFSQFAFVLKYGKRDMILPLLPDLIDSFDYTYIPASLAISSRKEQIVDFQEISLVVKTLLETEELTLEEKISALRSLVSKIWFLGDQWVFFNSFFIANIQESERFKIVESVFLREEYLKEYSYIRYIVRHLSFYLISHAPADRVYDLLEFFFSLSSSKKIPIGALRGVVDALTVRKMELDESEIDFKQIIEKYANSKKSEVRYFAYLMGYHFFGERYVKKISKDDKSKKMKARLEKYKSGKVSLKIYSKTEIIRKELKEELEEMTTFHPVPLKVKQWKKRLEKATVYEDGDCVFPEKEDNYDFFEVVDELLEEDKSGIAEKMLKLKIEEEPDEFNAYTLLWQVYSFQQRSDEALKWIEKGYKTGLSMLPKDFDPEKHRLRWGFLENRPFLRLVHALAFEYRNRNEFEKAKECAEFLINANPNDNQGVRIILAEIYMDLKEYERLDKLIDAYKDDLIALLMTHVLRCFMKGEKGKARNLLRRALKENKHIVNAIVRYPVYQDILEPYSESVVVGSEQEAAEYADSFYSFWKRIPGALDWLKRESGAIRRRR